MKILILKLKRIGDLILTTPALLALRQAFPDAHLTLCILENCEGLVPALPCVDETLVFRYRRPNLQLLARLARGGFDFCLDFTGNDRSAFFSLLSRAPRRITWGWVKRSRHRQLAFNAFVDSSVRENHTIDHHLDLLAPLGIERRDVPVTLHLPSGAEESAARILSEAGIEGRYAVVHPGTARAEKYWLPERWATIIDHVQGELGLPCLVTGSSAAFEQAHLQAIRAKLRTPWRDGSGKADLLGLAVLIRGATLLMSMDSAPVHFGAAFGTPQIALFGETNPFAWRPRHDRALVLYAGQAQPLTQFEPRAKPCPLSDLSTEAVLGAISSLTQRLQTAHFSHS
ncbi:MAG: glycosyltransferase family 9 protein [Verrucomicrobia bacterium]|nr:glycosyltransferase family 9 protein [Verrucomicrobiota bacterium]